MGQHSPQTLTRRRFLGVSAASMGALSGCPGRSLKYLQIEGIESTNTDPEWKLSIQVEASITGKYYDQGELVFRNVVLLGHDETGTRICQHRIGDIPDDQRRYETEVTLTCEERPSYLTFTTEGGSCATDVNIQALEYNSTREVYVPREQTCGGGGPPFTETTENG